MLMTDTIMSEKVVMQHADEMTDSTRSEKVVIQLADRRIKGYLDSPNWDTIEELLSHAPPASPETFRIRHLETNHLEEIPTRDIKAVFYVNCFKGDPEHKALNFHTRAPIVHGIWMRLQFRDGEIMEGIVHNSTRYLVDPGFFMVPTDPGSNNKLIYVVKNLLVDHRVLGLRKL
jgi:hypothetical protein